MAGGRGCIWVRGDGARGACGRRRCHRREAVAVRSLRFRAVRPAIGSVGLGRGGDIIGVGVVFVHVRRVPRVRIVHRGPGPWRRRRLVLGGLLRRLRGEVGQGRLGLVVYSRELGLREVWSLGFAKLAASSGRLRILGDFGGFKQGKKGSRIPANCCIRLSSQYNSSRAEK